MSRRHRTKDIDRLVQRLDTISLSSTAASVEPPPAVPAQPFRFFDLPSELRLRVYELLLVVPHTLDLDPSNTRTLAPSLRLLLASKRVESEASRVFYGRNTFRVFPIHGKYINKKHPLLAWLPRRYRSYITRLELRLGPGFTRPPKGWVVTPRLGLAAATRVYKLKIFVEIDPEASDVFAGFRVGPNFYTEYCVVLLRALLAQLPSVGEVEMDAYPGVEGDSPLVKALVGEAKLNQKRLAWGEGRSWDGIVDGDLAGALGRLGM
ncbi:hypothetical protein FB567DRAFT_239375 [Paraphoma chrysanthemicola]|uniref:F-box domain-containing protein n=1 Tax=Paraphoma chrysanthemicola TaxID=798071 RepID=A0A8K0RDX7_9PLEO|nr:hypothetical protein FB567DRAFT_239375 [Paraphoma chrysanthemicola]